MIRSAWISCLVLAPLLRSQGKDTCISFESECWGEAVLLRPVVLVLFKKSQKEDESKNRPTLPAPSFLPPQEILLHLGSTSEELESLCLLLIGMYSLLPGEHWPSIIREFTRGERRTLKIEKDHLVPRFVEDPPWTWTYWLESTVITSTLKNNKGLISHPSHPLTGEVIYVAVIEWEEKLRTSSGCFFSPHQLFALSLSVSSTGLIIKRHQIWDSWIELLSFCPQSRESPNKMPQTKHYIWASKVAWAHANLSFFGGHLSYS